MFSFSVNRPQPERSTISTNTDTWVAKGEGQNSTSIQKKQSTENYYLPALEDIQGTASTTFSRLDFPIRKMISKPELNSPEEIRFIEENVRLNSLLANLGVSWSTESFTSTDDYETSRIEDSDDDFFFKRITSEHPLLQPIDGSLPSRIPSDGSLIAVLDFDISDEVSTSSGVQREYSDCRSEC